MDFESSVYLCAGSLFATCYPYVYRHTHMLINKLIYSENSMVRQKPPREKFFPVEIKQQLH